MEVPRVIEIGKPLTDGWNRMTRFCFEPFDIGKWFAVGFCAFLYELADMGFNFNIGPNINLGGPRAAIADVFDWISKNGPLAALLTLGGIVLFICVFVILEYLGARGRFMFMHNLVHNTGEVSRPWSEYAVQATGFFVLRLKVLLLLGFAAIGLGLVCGAMAWSDFHARRWGAGSISAAVIALLGLPVMALTAALFKVLSADMIATHMFRNRSTAVEAWHATWEQVLTGNLGNLFLFYLVRILLGIPAWFVMVIGMLCTCCIGALPYLSSVLFLPISVFFRCFTLHYLRQFGPQWDVFEHNALECPLCGYDLRGNPAAVSCPECGADISPSATPQTNP